MKMTLNVLFYSLYRGELAETISVYFSYQILYEIINKYF